MKTIKLSFLFLFIILFSCNNSDSDMELIDETPAKIEKQSVVFITGKDEDDNTFYKNAKTHFSQQHLKIVEETGSIEDIIVWLNSNSDGKIYENIHIVSHSNAWRGLSLKTCIDGERITSEVLEGISFPKPNDAITENTNIIFHSCGLGSNKELMKNLKSIFSSEVSPKLYASEDFNIFGGKYASHYLAKPFYVFYPTANSPGTEALADEISYRYQSVFIDWKAALETREETAPGAVYSYRFNIPVDWDIVFDAENDVPELKTNDEMIDFILENDDLSLALYELGIPMEKFRWTSEKSDKTLKIIGKTTVLCVLIPVMDSYVPAEYSVADITHPKLYTEF